MGGQTVTPMTQMVGPVTQKPLLPKAMYRGMLGIHASEYFDKVGWR